MNIECKESEIIEFKQSLATIDDAIKTISSMLNKHHRGTIYFGIKDDGEIIGIILTDKNKRDIVEKIKTKIKPIIYPSIEEIKINNKTICKISFEAYDIPYSFEGRFYIRVGTTTSQMEISAIKELISKDISLEMEKRDSLISLNNLDTDAFTSYKNLINDKYKKFSDVKILEKLELTNGKNFNNAGKLLFSNSSSINLRMAMKWPDNAVYNDIEIKTNIWNGIEKSIEYLKQNINKKTIVSENHLHNKIEYEIPFECLREVVINAFVHRQYLNSAENIITITDKEVVIYSPGTFMGNTKPNDYLFGEGISRRRNEILANALKFCGYIEKFGTGIKRTYDICKERGIDFNIKTDNYGVFVSFSRNNFLDNKSKNQKNVDDLDELKNITPNNWKILLLLIKHKELKIREISNKIKLSVMQTNRYINKLIEEKLIIKNNQYCSLGLLKEKILFHALLTIGFDDINDINYNITTIKKEWEQIYNSSKQKVLLHELMNKFNHVNFKYNIKYSDLEKCLESLYDEIQTMWIKQYNI